MKSELLQKFFLLLQKQRNYLPRQFSPKTRQKNV